MEQELEILKTVPFYGRVLVVPSPVEEDELPSGLVLPHRFEGDSGIERGVVADMDRSFDEENPVRRAATEAITNGTVIWYRGGVRVRGFVVLELADIYAFERDA